MPPLVPMHRELHFAHTHRFLYHAGPRFLLSFVVASPFEFALLRQSLVYTLSATCASQRLLAYQPRRVKGVCRLVSLSHG